MANPWFRFYAEFATDPKIQFMSEPLQRRYVFALCVTCNGEIEKVTDEELAFAMRITPEEWNETKRVFIERGLFTQDGKVKNWEKRQYKSTLADPTNAERQKRYRNALRNGQRNGSCNGTVTAEKRSDTDTEKEYRGKKFSVPTVAEVSAYMQEIDYNGNADSFINHYESKGWLIGKNKMKDWKAAVRTWQQNDRKATAPAERQRRFEL